MKKRQIGCWAKSKKYSDNVFFGFFNIENNEINKKKEIKTATQLSSIPAIM